jgi:hypothetical protein
MPRTPSKATKKWPNCKFCSPFSEISLKADEQCDIDSTFRWCHIVLWLIAQELLTPSSYFTLSSHSHVTLFLVHSYRTILLRVRGSLYFLPGRENVHPTLSRQVSVRPPLCMRNLLIVYTYRYRRVQPWQPFDTLHVFDSSKRVVTTLIVPCSHNKERQSRSTKSASTFRQDELHRGRS